MSSRVCVVEGNSRDGQLWALGTTNAYEGTRRVLGGKFETRRFFGSEREVRATWRAWRDEAREEASLVVRRGRGRQARSKAPSTDGRDERMTSWSAVDNQQRPAKEPVEEGREESVARQDEARLQSVHVLHEKGGKMHMAYPSERDALHALALLGGLGVAEPGELVVTELRVWYEDET